MAEVATPAKKVTKAKTTVVKKPRSHPPYLEMINEAISSLKERTGSSQYAIAKHMEEKQKDLPPNFKKLLLVQLRKLVAAGKLTKVKNSFKIAAPGKAAPVAPVKKAAPPEKKRKATGKVEKKAKKVAKTEKVTTPTKKKATAGKVKKAAPKKATPVKVKKATPVKVKKVKTIKSPAKKAAAKKAAKK